MKTRKRYKIRIIAAALFILPLLSLFFGGGVSVYAATSEVLSDLQKDESFNLNKYPFIANDYKIEVIQVAESDDDKLVIYTYQPSAHPKVKASSVNIAKQEDGDFDLSFENYKLTLLSSDNVFYKYRVEGFELEETDVRYYNISNILRPFEYMLDKVPGVGSISEVPNEVGQVWTARTVGGNVEYAMTSSEIVTITQKYVGYISYLDGVTMDVTTNVVSGRHTIRNFVAFSTDKPIDRLIQVELQYDLADCSFEYCANPYHAIADDSHGFKDYINRTKGESVTQSPVTLSADDKDENFVHGWFGHKYEWKKIQSTSDFLAEQENQDYELINTAGLNSINDTQWILNFYKAERELSGVASPIDNHVTCNYKAVSDVILLRLMFEYDGDTYNLGVVDSKMTGDDKPLNSPAPLVDPLPTWAWVLIVVGIVLIVLIVLAIVFPGFGKVVGGILLGLWKVISAPFRAIGNAVKSRRERKEEERQAMRLQEQQMRLYKHKNNLERKEVKRQSKLDEKDAEKAKKAKDKQTAARSKKAAENKRKTATTKNKAKGKKK